LAKPVLSSIDIFDASIGGRINFQIYTSNTEIKSYEYEIYSGSNFILSHSGESSDLSYNSNTGYSFAIVPNEKLKNQSSNYSIRVRVKLSSEDTFGTYSSLMTFYCKSRPVLSFNGLTPVGENTFETSSIVFELKYSYVSSENELLKNYKYQLYNADKILLDESDMYYGSISNSFSAYNLENGNKYFIRGIGETRNGYELDTGFYLVKIGYSGRDNTFALNATNNKDNGCIDITSHFISVTGVPNGEFSYVQSDDGNYYIDLTNRTSVTYSIPSTYKELYDFDIKLFTKSGFPNELATLVWQNDSYNVVGKIKLNTRKFTDSDSDSNLTYAIFQLFVNEKQYLIIQSNYLENYDSSKLVLIDLVLRDKLFDIHINSIN
jgi:hypothetical protein